jgi:membrane protein DedA with SNARE-associated domain
VGREALLENVIPALGFPFELLHRAMEIFDQRLLFRFMVIDDKLRLRIDLKTRFATRTLDFEKLSLSLRHTGIVAQSMLHMSCYSLDCETMDAVFAWILRYGYAGLFALLMLGIVGLPVPDETLLVFCGYLIWKGHFDPLATFLAGFGGSVCGISISYVLGRTCGHVVISRYGRWIGLTPQRLDRVHRWFDRLGTWLLSVGYFIPGVRHFTALVAGTAGLNWRAFALFAYFGAAFWVAFFLSLGYVMGEKWQQSSTTIHKYVLLILVIAVATGGVVWLVRRHRAARRDLK